MGGAGRVNDQAARVTDVGQVGEEADIVDNGLAGLVAPFDAKGKDGTGTAWQIAPGQFIVRTIGQAWIVNPADCRMFLEELSDLKRVLAVPFHTQRERLQTLQ